MVILNNCRVLWSRPIPLGWYFAPQWKRFNGDKWAHGFCENWIEYDRDMRPFSYELPTCPCMLHQATSDKGRYVPDYECDRYGNAQCYYHQGASMCYRSGLTAYNYNDSFKLMKLVTSVTNFFFNFSRDGGGQQCCYDKDGLLMMTSDNKWGGNPGRSHNLGIMPWNEAGKV